MESSTTAAYPRWERIRPPIVLPSLLTVALTGGVGFVHVLFYAGLGSAIGPLALVSGNVAAAVATAWVLSSGLDTGTESVVQR